MNCSAWKHARKFQVWDMRACFIEIAFESEARTVGDVRRTKGKGREMRRIKLVPYREDLFWGFSEAMDEEGTSGLYPNEDERIAARKQILSDPVPKEGGMSWILAFAIIAVAVALLVSGAVGAVVDWLFGIRR